MLLGTASFCVAGAALGASPARFVWQAQHSEHLRFVLRGRSSTWSTRRRVMTLGAALFCVAGAVLGAPHVRFAWKAQHSEHLRFVLRGRCSFWSTSGSFCVAGAALGAPQVRFAWQAQHLVNRWCVLRFSSQICRELRRWVLKSGWSFIEVWLESSGLD